MKSSEGWDLLSIGEISPDKIQKNLKEASVFLANDEIGRASCRERV